MFKALSSGKASIVTDEIQALTPSGVRTKSGRELAADIIISVIVVRSFICSKFDFFFCR